MIPQLRPTLTKFPINVLDTLVDSTRLLSKSRETLLTGIGNAPSVKAGKRQAIRVSQLAAPYSQIAHPLARLLSGQ